MPLLLLVLSHIVVSQIIHWKLILSQAIKLWKIRLLKTDFAQLVKKKCYLANKSSIVCHFFDLTHCEGTFDGQLDASITKDLMADRKELVDQSVLSVYSVCYILGKHESIRTAFLEMNRPLHIAGCIYPGPVDI